MIKLSHFNPLNMWALNITVILLFLSVYHIAPIATKYHSVVNERKAAAAYSERFYSAVEDYLKAHPPIKRPKVSQNSPVARLSGKAATALPKHKPAPPDLIGEYIRKMPTQTGHKVAGHRQTKQ